MKILLWVLIGYAAIMLLVTLEGRRQKRALQRRGESLSTGSRMMAAGMLELQGHLQADRKVEVLQMEIQDEDRVHPIHRKAEEGEGEEPAEPGGRGREEGDV